MNIIRFVKSGFVYCALAKIATAGMEISGHPSTASIIHLLQMTMFTVKKNWYKFNLLTRIVCDSMLLLLSSVCDFHVGNKLLFLSFPSMFVRQ